MALFAQDFLEAGSSRRNPRRAIRREFSRRAVCIAGAVEDLRALRRQSFEKNPITIISSADPLNLVGILTPGVKVSPFSSLAIAYENGNPLEIGELGQVLSRLQGKISIER